MTIKCGVYPVDPVDKLQAELLLGLMHRLHGMPLPEGSEWSPDELHLWLPSGMSQTAYRRLFYEQWQRTPEKTKLLFYHIMLNSGLGYVEEIVREMQKVAPAVPAIKALQKRLRASREALRDVRDDLAIAQCKTLWAPPAAEDKTDTPHGD